MTTTVTYSCSRPCDQRRNTWLDPTRGRTTVAEWVATWFAALDLDPRTIDNYRSVLRCHILLRWGATPLGAITALGVNKWISDLRQLGYANTTVATIVKVLSMILTDAADEGLIPTNPSAATAAEDDAATASNANASGQHPPKSSASPNRPPHSAATPPACSSSPPRWTGCRWGELTGLRRDNVDLDRGV